MRCGEMIVGGQWPRVMSVATQAEILSVNVLLIHPDHSIAKKNLKQSQLDVYKKPDKSICVFWIRYRLLYCSIYMSFICGKPLSCHGSIDVFVVWSALFFCFFCRDHLVYSSLSGLLDPEVKQVEAYLLDFFTQIKCRQSLKKLLLKLHAGQRLDSCSSWSVFLLFFFLFERCIVPQVCTPGALAGH